MRFAAPADVSEQATFFFPPVADASGAVVDGEGIPYDPDATVEYVRAPSVRVPCAITYSDATGSVERFGRLTSADIVLTLVEPDYRQVQGFEYVEVAGQRYTYRHTFPPVALFDLNVWSIRCETEDQA